MSLRPKPAMAEHAYITSNPRETTRQMMAGPETKRLQCLMNLQAERWVLGLDLRGCGLSWQLSRQALLEV